MKLRITVAEQHPDAPPHKPLVKVVDIYEIEVNDVGNARQEISDLVCDLHETAEEIGEG